MPYHDPYNLEYYLLTDIPDNEIQILNKFSEETAFGEIQIAVVGSSHFFYLYKEFCELLTCRSLKRSNDFFCMKDIKEQFLTYKQIFDNFSYDFSLDLSVFSDKEFSKLENNLNQSKHTLIHAFNRQSALTVLDFKNISENKLKLETWHTYPESLVSVHTETLITRL